MPRFGPEIVGGAESLARRLARVLAARGWDVEVWSTRASDDGTWAGRLAEEQREDGYNVRRFGVVWRRPPRAFRQATRAFFRLPAALRPEALWLRAQGPFSPALVSALASAPPRPTLFIPYLYYPTVYGLPAAPHPRVLIPAAHDERPLRLRAVGRAIADADALWYSTPEERDLVEAVHPEVRAIHNDVGTVGVDVVAGDAERFRRRFELWDPFLLYGGRANVSKGLEMLFEAFTMLKRRRAPISLVCAGADAAGQAPDGVVAVGRLDEESWHDALTGALGVVVPSEMESLSLLALEGWAAGRPCLANVASPVLAGQLERSGGGLTFRGATGLADAALQLLSNPVAADAMGAAGHQYVIQHYSWESVVRRLSALLTAA